MTNPPETRQITVPARMPVPGNAEFLLLVVLVVVIAIVAACLPSTGAESNLNCWTYAGPTRDTPLGKRICHWFFTFPARSARIA